MTQVNCPDWVRYVAPPRTVNYDTARASAMYRSDPTWIVQLPAGTHAATLPTQFFADANGRLWMYGRSSIGHQPTETTVLVERVEEGVRVLYWPPGAHVLSETTRPNAYGQEDMWVVEFPEQPA